MSPLAGEKVEALARGLCASRDLTDDAHEAQDVPCGPCWRDAQAVAPLVAEWLAEERERIAAAIETQGQVCINAHGDRCIGGIAYRDAARIARGAR